MFTYHSSGPHCSTVRKSGIHTLIRIPSSLSRSSGGQPGMSYRTTAEAVALPLEPEGPKSEHIWETVGMTLGWRYYKRSLQAELQCRGRAPLYLLTVVPGHNILTNIDTYLPATTCTSNQTLNSFFVKCTRVELFVQGVCLGGYCYRLSITPPLHTMMPLSGSELRIIVDLHNSNYELCSSIDPSIELWCSIFTIYGVL